ncbi:hypothetical protein N7G274_004947 [Stereocaulon virgatum]|uniref:Ankyrin n=1 Tax=Stereocaulon virgatum TaxID=373712 RepID=A0ABR4A9K9_9LECA
MVTKLRNERRNHPKKDRTSPGHVKDGSDISFHINSIVVKDWLGRLKNRGGSQRLDEVLDIAAGMLAPKPKNRPYMWEVQMDLYETLKPYDRFFPNLGRDLCVRPPFKTGQRASRSHEIPYNLQPEIQEYTETPLHRAAEKNNRPRTIRLWELGWPISPDPNEETLRDIMKTSDDIGLRPLEDGVILMLEAARTGNLGELRKLFSRGLSPLMVDADGRSALHEAITSFQLDVIDCLLESKAKEQLMLWNKARLELPLHTAAKLGFMEASERMLEYYPDVNVSSGDGYSTALYHATEGSHLEVVYDIVELLLEADDSHECMEYKDGWGMIALLLAADIGRDRCFEILLRHKASVHAVRHDGMNLLHILAIKGRQNLLRQCIDISSSEDPGCGDYQATPLKLGQDAGHKEVARLLKNYIHKAQRSDGSDPGLLASFRNGLQKFKAP